MSIIDKINALATDPAATNGERAAAVEALRRLGVKLEMAQSKKVKMEQSTPWLKFRGDTEKIEQIKALAGVKSLMPIKDYWIVFCDNPQQIENKIKELLEDKYQMQPALKKIEEVVPGDWYDEREVIGIKDWGFAVDLHFRDGGMKMIESEVIVLVVPAAEAVDVIK